MRIIDLALKDLRQLSRDKRAFMMSLVMPIIFILVFGYVFGGGGGSEEVDPRLPVGFINQDSGQLAAELVVWLEHSEVVQLVHVADADLEALQEQVAAGDLSGVLVIPAGYSQGLLDGTVMPLQIILDPASSSGTTIKQAVLVAAMRVHSAVLAAHTSVAAYERQQAFDDAISRQTYFDAALAKALIAWENPPIQTRQTQTGQPVESLEEQVYSDNAFAQSSPCMMMQFAIAGLMSAAEIIVAERRTRSLQRLLTTSISRVEILLGHFLAIFTMNFIQVFVIMLFGQLFLGLDYMVAPLASLLMAVTIAMVMGGMGLLIGALSKTAENAVVLSLVPMFVFSALGGAWVPLEFTSKTVQIVGHFSPVAWGMDGLKNILVRGQGLEAVWLPAGMLLLMTAIFFGLAAWRFKFE